MTPATRRQLQTILDRHNDLARALRRTSDASDAAQAALEASGRALRDANQGMREALDGLIAANGAALALFHTTDAGSDGEA